VRLELNHKKDALAGLVLLLLSAFAYGITPALTKLAFRAHLDELSLITLRSALAAAAVAAAAWVVREPAIRPASATRLAALGAAMYAPQMWLYYTSLHRLDTTVAVAAVYIYPAIVTLIMAVRLRRPPPRLEVALIGIAVIGVTTIAVSAGASHTGPLGISLAVTAALLYAGYVVIAASLTATLPPLRSTTWVLVGTTAASAAAAAVTGRLALPGNATAWGYLFVHGLAVVPIGLTAFYAGLRRLGPLRTALVDTVQPVIAVTVGMALLGEEITPARAVGFLLVILAVAGIPVLSSRSAATDSRGEPAGTPRVRGHRLRSNDISASGSNAPTLSDVGNAASGDSPPRSSASP
jgi:drug/metabolite transporter (DMT)-like permease